MKKQINSFKAEAIPTAQLHHITGGEDCGPGTATPAGSKTFGAGTPDEITYKYSSDCTDNCGTHYTWVPGQHQGMASGGSGVNTDFATTSNGTIGALSFNP